MATLGSQHRGQDIHQSIRIRGAAAHSFVAAIVALVALAIAHDVRGQQLQVTEIMSNPLSPNDDAWEWIEVRNTGATPVDLDGYIIDRLGDPKPSSVLPSINSVQTSNTVIPAGGVAVLYDADVAVTAADFNDATFRQAWQLAPSVPLIGVSGNFGGGLTNGAGTAIGAWANPGAYELDLAPDEMDVTRVVQLTNAAFSIDYRGVSGFPAVSDGVSIAWNGTGSNQMGENWAATTTGTTSIAATVPGSVNDVRDVANPGIAPPGTPPAGLRFTEIMYNPRSAESTWEWVEVFNGGPTINFAATPYVFDDDDDAAKSAANLTTGSIATGTAAVLFNASTTNGITLSDMQAAWDPQAARGINFIPVSTWTDLAQGGDTVALWPSLAAYQGETPPGTGRSTNNAVAAVAYENFDDDATWPNDDGNGSIFLADLGFDPATGTNWDLSSPGDSIGSFNAAAIDGTITIHPGGDLGTPGVFGAAPLPTNNADFDNDGDVDGADFVRWQRGLGQTGLAAGDKSTGDANGDGKVDSADLTIWKAHYHAAPGVVAAGAVPEPGSLVLSWLAFAATARWGRRRGT